MTPAACPDVRCLQALLNDGGHEDEPGDLIHHLETCIDCQHTLHALAAEPDAWVSTARGLTDPARDEPALRRLVERLKREDAPAGDDLAFLRPAGRPDVLGLLGPYEVQEEI